MNGWLNLESKGIPRNKIAKEGNDIFIWMNKKLSSHLNWILTATFFEHLTALMDDIFLKSKFLQKRIFMCVLYWCGIRLRKWSIEM